MLLRQIERYIRQSGMPPTRFGREAVNDPRFVHDLRLGREPRPKTAWSGGVALNVLNASTHASCVAFSQVGT